MSDEAPQRKAPVPRRKQRRREPLRVGRVLSVAFQTYLRRLPLFAYVSLLLAAAHFLYSVRFGVVAAIASADNDAMAQYTPAGMAAWSVEACVRLLMAAVCAALVHQQVAEGKADLGAGLLRVATSLRTVLVVAVTIAFAQLVGQLLCGIGLFFVLVYYWLAMPALLAERGGALAALGRSANLSSGSRWRILGVVLLLWLIPETAVGVGVILVAAIDSQANAVELADMAGRTIVLVAQAVASLLAAQAAVVSAIAATHGFHQLAGTAQGLDSPTVAEVFE